MARASKRDFIVEVATGLFMEHGFKGTSVDMVVSACGVSKPTVYNHFPDKVELLQAVLSRWVEQRLAAMPEVSSWPQWQAGLTAWFDDEVLAMYRLVLGEGWRFEAAAQLFWQGFDQPWRQQVMQLAQRPGQVEARLDQALWKGVSQGLQAGLQVLQAD